ncbi:type I polyketide synthase [Leptolyngbya sp. FACHB-16]|uniref:type I polyketide synthase n=1 Tax=unclassified Leptolyngbya TaxID=2650499 RepID=UPI001688B8EE|nr:type I polyketide synthase [Leptolyngbya sp. FACHB-16]MBD2158900.1 type I polyketide synthase [Leptolyngbya sp. FACHB-16]
MTQTDDKIAELTSSQRLLLALKEAKAQLEHADRSKTEPIAIVGMGCRFPGGANNPESFWQLLCDGVDAIAKRPHERWDSKAYYDPDPDAAGKIYTQQGGFLQNVDQFDPFFFGISPREAASLDPQQRLLLEVSWEALEHAGQAPNELSGSQTGFFVGIGQNDYAKLILNSQDLKNIDVYACTGNGFCFASGRLSYALGLQGPSMAIDTACSSSLVAVHLACQSLRAGECAMALAAGVHLILTPEVTVGQCNMRVLSPDGRCKTFDASADGFGQGEGCGVIVLKRLSDAIAHGDNVLALIRGSAVNHDGPSSGLTVPNGTAQQELIRQALKSSRVKPAQVRYVETHGTGTVLGDPIEVRALSAVLGEGRSPNNPLIIGSVKTNIGHLDAAAGISGLIKVVLALQHQEVPPHLHFKQPNPNIAWDELPITVPTQRTALISSGEPLIAGVSSFGLSGTNAHVLVESAPIQPPIEPKIERPAHIFTLSAKTPEALHQLIKQHEKYLLTNPKVSLGNICFTANVGRSHFDHRFSMIASNTTTLREKLVAFTSNREGAGQIGVKSSNQPKIAFLFTGQGSQYAGMGQQLYETQPSFRAVLDQCQEILYPYLDIPLLEVLSEPSLIDQTVYTQPALFALEYALYQLWKSWGVAPRVVIGHSLGEYTAACAAGVFSLEDALKLVAARGRFMQSLPPGGEMVAVLASVESVREAIQVYGRDVAIAAINTPNNVVISGKSSSVTAIVTSLHAQNIETKQLAVSHAFHSPLMQPILAQFEEVAQQMNYSPPHLNIISNVTGKLITEEIATSEYWCRHLQQPVMFAAGMETLDGLGTEIFVEVGPRPTLLAMGRQCLPDKKGEWLPSLHPKYSNWEQILQSLSRLYVSGVDVDWSGFEYGDERQRVVLPTYPFQRQRYWIQPPSTTSKKTAETSSHSVTLRELLRPLNKLAHLPGSYFWEIELSNRIFPYLNDHRIQGVIVLPGTAYLGIAQAGADEVFGIGSYFLEDVEFQKALFLRENDVRRAQLILSPKSDGETAFEIYSQLTNAEPNHVWILHATGKIQINKQSV